MFQFLLRNPILVAVGTLLACLFGVLALVRVPIQLIPDLDVRVISIVTGWPGATPQDVEREILIEQEDYLRGITGIERMTSRASMGRAEIELELARGTDLNEALIQVNNSLSQVPSYPENVDEPRIVADAYSNSPFIFVGITTLASNPFGLDLYSMRDYLDDNVRPRLERVAGVAEAELRGGAERQIHIRIDPARLAERGISLAALRTAIRNRNRDTSGGDLDAGKARYLIRTIGRFESLNDIEDMIVAQRNGAPVYLRDVASVSLDQSELRYVNRVDTRPVLSMAVRRIPGANVVGVRNAVRDQLERLNEGYLGSIGLQAHIVTEDARYVEDAVVNVRSNLALGGVLATLVLFAFLRSIGATVVGAIGIPVCTLAAFIGLLLSARTVNVISLAGVAFAIGMTLDNSIVVLENIARHLARGQRRMQAVLEGVSEVWRAVLASTLTTVFVFLPVLFIREEAGQLYSDIAVAISSSILMSMLVAIAVVPSAAKALSFRPRQPPDDSGEARGLTALVLANARWVADRPIRQLTLMIALLATTGAVLAFLTPQAEYLPEGEEKKAFARLFPPPGTNLEEIRLVMDEIGEELKPHLGRDPSEFDRGEMDYPAIDYMFQFARQTGVTFVIETTRRQDMGALIEKLTARFEQVPGMNGFVSRGSIFAGNEGGTRSINVDITGPDLAGLYDAALALFNGAKAAFRQPQVRAEPSGLTLGQPVLEVHPDWTRAAELGFTAPELGYAVWALTDGAFVDEFFLEDDKIDMYLYGTQGTVRQPQDLADILVFAPVGAVVPLNAIAEVRETRSTDVIRRVDGFRTVTVSIVPPRDVPLEGAVARVEEKLIPSLRAEGLIASNVDMRLSGASDRLAATQRALASNFAISAIIAYLLLVAILRHWGFPLVIMLVVPIGISGGIVGLWLLNQFGAALPLVGLEGFTQPFDMITMLGFLILMGTVVNNPILIVEKTMSGVQAGLVPRQAILDATHSRLRAVLMSTITTVIGISPLVFIPGAGTELYRGVGAVVLFGLLSSAVVTLFFLPAVLGLVYGVAGRQRRGSTAVPNPGSGAAWSPADPPAKR
ncbi:MAG: efflux RND transporter permease subunit [Pseudomonadota bacterium]